jgi:hypothetical protein
MRDFEELGRALGRPARWLNLAGLALLAIGVGTGAVLHSIGVNRALSIAVADAIIVLGIGGLWLRFLNGRHAPAYEAILHHELIERAEWRRATGSTRPRNRRQADGWLRRHPEPVAPSAPDLVRRATMLMWVARGDEAGLALRRARADTPLDRFLILLETGTLDTLEGRTVDLRPIREAFLAIEEQAERRLRRICLGGLEAQIALADGGDPWEPMLQARRDLDRVAPAATLRAVTARVFALVIVLAGLAALTLAFIGR